MDGLLGALIIGGVAALFVALSSLRQKRIQPQLDAFARAYCELCDHMLCGERSFGAAATEPTGGELLRVLPAERQPEALRALFVRGVDDFALERLSQMFALRAEAQAHLTVINLIGKRINGVLNHIYDMTNISLSVINDQNVLLKKDDLESLNLFLNKQDYIRNTTLASIVSDECKQQITR